MSTFNRSNKTFSSADSIGSSTSSNSSGSGSSNGSALSKRRRTTSTKPTHQAAETTWTRRQNHNLFSHDTVVSSRLLRCIPLLLSPLLLVGLVSLMSKYKLQQQEQSGVLRKGSISNRSLLNMPEIISQQPSNMLSLCRENAIVYLVKKHYDGATGKATYGNLIKSLDLLHENYLEQKQNAQNAHLFLFHTGDFDTYDLQQFESRYHDTTIYLVNLGGTPYWSLPDGPLQEDDPTHWAGQYSMWERHEHRFFAVHLWDYFDRINRWQGCSYRYVMRMDPDAFLYSQIHYDLFDHVSLHNYQYAYRLCQNNNHAINMDESLVWKEFIRANQDASPVSPHRRGSRPWNEANDCIMENHFFLADLQFFLSPKVQRFLRFVDRGGYLYQHNVDDAMIHTTAVYAYARQDETPKDYGQEDAKEAIEEMNQDDAAPPADMGIHRFLDFTYERFEWHKGCPIKGALQAGYRDDRAEHSVSEWTYLYLGGSDHACENSKRIQVDKWTHANLSPTFSHLPDDVAINELALLSVTAGVR